MMSSDKFLGRWSHHPMEDASDSLSYRARQLAHKPVGAGGFIVLALVVVAFIWMFPEIRRYVHMRRM
jgi:hypothetical protein